MKDAVVVPATHDRIHRGVAGRTRRDLRRAYVLMPLRRALLRMFIDV